MTTIEDLAKDSNRKNPANGRNMPLHMANPHTNFDVVHGAGEASEPSQTHVVQYQVDVSALENAQSDFVDVAMALDAAKTYSLSVSGYAAYSLVQTSANRQDSTTVRVVVENQSGDIVPATQILITATSL